MDLEKRNNNQSSKSSSKATAPYNFVSLPEKIVPAPLNELIRTDADQSEVRRQYREYILKNCKNSGYIDITVTAETPCFIGGNGESFFGPLGEPLIPGSSLRGMIKNLFKMLTCGAMRPGEDLTEKHLYSRGLAASGRFGQYYKDRMTIKITDKNGKKVNRQKSKASPGFLIKVRDKYYICQAEKEILEYKNGIKRDARIDFIDNYAEIHTGEMKGKKHYYKIYGADWREEHWIPVSEGIIAGYKDDKTRKGIDLFTVGKKESSAAGFAHDKSVEFVVPCFYTAKDDKVVHFGQGPYYRIPYEKSIGEHIPEAVKAENVIDFADAVFGRKELWGSRVCFGDAKLCGQANVLPASYPHPMLSPNPTSFQLYLQQSGNGVNHVQHWDDSTILRGYKQYWHNPKADWRIGGNDKQVNGMIAPLDKGARFNGRISFNDLSDIELGALLEVFELSKNGHPARYKLGGGKPLGLGSVRIDSELKLVDDNARYSRLFADDGWNIAANKTPEKQYLQAFHDYLAGQLGGAAGKQQYEKLMQELKLLLDFNNARKQGWSEKLKYMPVGDKNYSNREVLPTPAEVVKK